MDTNNFKIQENARIVCHQYLQPLYDGVPPLISEEDVRKIEDSMNKQETKLYNRYKGCFFVYRKMMTSLAICHGHLFGTANDTLKDLQLWESYEQEENHLNYIIDTLRSICDDKSYKTFKESLKALTFKSAELKILNDGYISIDINGENMLYDIIESDIIGLKQSISIVKALLTLLDKFGRKYQCEKMIYPNMLFIMESCKNDHWSNDLPQFSRKRLKEKISRGMKVTDMERYKAVFPSYDEIKPSTDFLDFYGEILNEEIKNYIGNEQI